MQPAAKRPLFSSMSIYGRRGRGANGAKSSSFACSPARGGSANVRKRWQRILSRDGTRLVQPRPENLHPTTVTFTQVRTAINNAARDIDRHHVLVLAAGLSYYFVM